MRWWAVATKVYPRPCFCCGGEMVQVYDTETTVYCRRCEVSENGTMTGRFHLSPSVAEYWGDVELVDHGGTKCFPSPDIISGYELKGSVR